MSEEKKTKFCSNCGVEIDIKAKICPKCGAEQLLIPEKVSNWWYFLPIFLGIIGGLIAWAVNKDRNPKKAIIFLVLGLVMTPISIVILLGILSSVVLVSLNKTREEAKEARIMANMDQLRAAIETSYMAQEESYSGANCLLTELSPICSNIKKYADEMPTIKSSAENYCLYVKLSGGEYYCLMNTFAGRKTTIFPGGPGYCDGVTFSCP